MTLNITCRYVATFCYGNQQSIISFMKIKNIIKLQILWKRSRCGDAYFRPFVANHSRGTKPPSWREKSRTGTRQTKARHSYIILRLFHLFVLSQSDVCSPARRFCTAWMASCKGPIVKPTFGPKSRFSKNSADKNLLKKIWQSRILYFGVLIGIYIALFQFCFYASRRK